MKNKVTFSVSVLAAGVIAFLAIRSTSSAAPMPGTATSKLVSPQLGIYRSPLGFEIGAGTSGWVHAQAPSNTKFVATLYHAPKKAGANMAKADVPSLTVRVDHLDHETSIDKYIQKWMKEYPKYGFDVLNSRPFAENKQKGYFLDLLNKESGKQLRQVVFLKSKRAVILTCRDKQMTFKDTLKTCNQIVRTFQWTE